VKSNAACGQGRMDKSMIARFVLIGLLCFCVTMQTLGTPVSFWEMNEAEDLVESSLLEGFSLPSLGVAVSVSLNGSLSSASLALEHNILLAQSLFHPPISYA
jgi:hypothetical protein